MTIERGPHFRPGHCASAKTRLQLGPDHHSIRQYGAAITSVRPKSSPLNSNGAVTLKRFARDISVIRCDGC